MYNHYSPPPGFAWDTLASDDPFVDDPFLETFNADQKSEDLYNYLLGMRDSYRTNHLLIPFGDDFNYQDAKMDF